MPCHEETLLTRSRSEEPVILGGERGEGLQLSAMLPCGQPAGHAGDTAAFVGVLLRERAKPVAIEPTANGLALSSTVATVGWMAARWLRAASQSCRPKPLLHVIRVDEEHADEVRSWEQDEADQLKALKEASSEAGPSMSA